MKIRVVLGFFKSDLPVETISSVTGLQPTDFRKSGQSLPSGRLTERDEWYHEVETSGIDAAAALNGFLSKIHDKIDPIRTLIDESDIYGILDLWITTEEDGERPVLEFPPCLLNKIAAMKCKFGIDIY